MIRQTLLMISIILPAIPFIILLILGDVVMGLSLMLITIAIGLIGALLNNPQSSSWFSLIMSLIISLASQGYIPYVFHIALVQITNPALFNGSIVLVEFSLISSYLYRNYLKYTKEFSSKGYDKAEFNYALNELSKWILTLLGIALAITLALYYVITTTPVLMIDPFTALVIFAAAYIVISRYVIARIRSS
ncbi:MAG: hypothetical protein ACP5NQ_02840 [Vulcanisaeta sp.]